MKVQFDFMFMVFNSAIACYVYTRIRTYIFSYDNHISLFFCITFYKRFTYGMNCEQWSCLVGIDGIEELVY